MIDDLFGGLGVAGESFPNEPANDNICGSYNEFCNEVCARDSLIEEVLRKAQGDALSNQNQNKGTHMLKDLMIDAKGFLKEHKSVIYVITLVFVLDQVFLKGALYERLKGILESLLTKAEAKIKAAELE